MNIVVLSHRLPFPPNKGEKIRTYNQLEYLRKQGCNVTLFSTVESDKDQSLADEYGIKTGFKIITTRSRFRKLAMFLGLFKGRAFSVSNFYSSDLQDKLNEHAVENVIDAIYCTSSSMAEYIFKGDSTLREKKHNRRDLIDFMDLDSDKWHQYRLISRFPKSFIYRYEKVMLSRYESRIQKRFDECIFISKNETNLFEKALPVGVDNLKVIGNGVDESAFYPPSEKRTAKAKILLFSGVMDYFPNENAMIWFVDQVWPELKAKYSDLTLVIAGMNPSSAIQEMANDERIHVTGYVDDMLACYHAASIFVAPFQIARGVQNKILQAYACGLPVVTTTVGAEGIDCIDGTHYLKADDADTFINQIDNLVNDQDLYCHISLNGLKLVKEEFTWEASNKKLFKLFANPENESRNL